MYYTAEEIKEIFINAMNDFQQESKNQIVKEDNSDDEYPLDLVEIENDDNLIYLYFLSSIKKPQKDDEKDIHINLTVMINKDYLAQNVEIYVEGYHNGAGINASFEIDDDIVMYKSCSVNTHIITVSEIMKKAVELIRIKLEKALQENCD